MITVACEACGKIHHVKDEFLGKTGRCQCGSKFPIVGERDDNQDDAVGIPAAKTVAPAAAGATKLCPFCAETIASAAKKCRHCGEFLDGTARAAPPAIQSRTTPETISPNESIVPHALPEAFTRVSAAMRSIGTVTSANPTANVIEGVIAFGMQKVKTRVSLAGAGDGRTMVVFQGKSDDVWGVAAKNAAKRFFETLRNADTVGYQPSRRGVPTAMIVVIIVTFFVVVFALMAAVGC